MPPIVLILSTHEAVGRYDVSRLKRIYLRRRPARVPSLSRACAKSAWLRSEQGYGLTENATLTHSRLYSVRNVEGKIGRLAPRIPRQDRRFGDR